MNNYSPIATDTRSAVATLLRIGEPGDGLMQGLVEEIGPCQVLDLITEVASGHRCPQAGAEVIAELGNALPGSGHTAAAMRRWAMRAEGTDGRHDLEIMARMGARLVMPGDAEWPPLLSDLGPAAPLGLWVRGVADLRTALARAVAIVGSRAASNYGTKCSSDLAWDLAARGVTVVSGGAFGIDAAAHRAAIAREGTTIAFMAGGVDRFYPSAHADLFEQVLEHGAIVSETAPGMTPMRHRFLLRNRLIAASSLATVVVEAGWRSGALNTAHHALEISREVAAFPGSVYSASSAGCHRLLRLHEAELVTNSQDVLELLEPEALTLFGPDNRMFDTAADKLDEREQICLNALSATKGMDPATVAHRAGLTLAETLSALAALELMDLSARHDAGWVKVRPKSAANT